MPKQVYQQIKSLGYPHCKDGGTSKENFKSYFLSPKKKKKADRLGVKSSSPTDKQQVTQPFILKSMPSNSAAPWFSKKISSPRSGLIDKVNKHSAYYYPSPPK